MGTEQIYLVINLKQAYQLQVSSSVNVINEFTCKKGI